METTKNLNERERLHEKAMYDLRVETITALIKNQHQVSEAADKLYLSLAERDDYSLTSNSLGKKAIKLGLEDIGKFTFPIFRANLSMKTINMIREFYGIDEPTTSFRISHPFMARRLEKACLEYQKAAKELLEKENDAEKQKRLMANLVKVENIGKRLKPFFGLKRA